MPFLQVTRPLVAREDELVALRSAIARTAEGHPTTVLVAGDAGVGKSRLLAEFAAGLQAGSVLVLVGHCVELGNGELPYAVVLPRGAQRLRVKLTIGSQQIVGATRRMEVRRARRWSTREADAGPYTGRAGSRSVRLTVTDRGRTLRGFRAFVPMLCPGVSPGQFTTQIGTAIVSRAKIAPDGRFVAASTSGGDTAIKLRGRLQRRAVSGGRVQLSVGNCSGSASFRASRAG